MVSPLKLKSERVGRVTLTEKNPFISVLVDTGVFHLDHEFDYSLPAKFDLNVGDWVSVPFNGRNCLGLITSRSSKSTVSKVQPINKSAKGPKLSKEHISLYKAVAERWAVPIFDVLRFVTKFRTEDEEVSFSNGEGKRIYIQLPPVENEIASVKKLADRLSKDGATLVIVPEARIAEALTSESFDVAMRSTVLTPKKYVNIVVLREESEHHFEIKSPGFNTRDVALLRNEYLKENIIFTGYSPSLEMARLLEAGYIQFKKSPGRASVLAKPSQQGELIPSALIKNFKDFLSKGPVLVIAPAKGYGLAISCASCRNIAHCQCGGKLTKLSKSTDPICVICAKKYVDWRCSYCQKDRIYLLGRGIERIAEDFGKAFPNTAIHISTADKEFEGDLPKRSIMIATVGTAPDIKFSTVLILEGLNLNSDMRSEERYLSTLFKYAAYSDGNIMVVQRDENPAINSIVKWNPLPYLYRTLAELAETQLPPLTRHALIKSEDSDRIYAGLIAAQRDGRITTNTRIYNLGNGVISIFFTIKEAKNFLGFIYEFQKRRSMSGKPLLKLRIDPYLLG